jgi:hypothetical protein
VERYNNNHINHSQFHHQQRNHQKKKIYKIQHDNFDGQTKKHKFKYKDRDGDLAHSSLSALLTREVEVSKENDK